MLCSLGQDMQDSLYWTTRNEPSKILLLLGKFFGVVLYVLIHALVNLSRMISLTIAVNSYDSSMFTLLISNNFVEVKSSIFKRFRTENLFQISCADIVERFQTILFLVMIGMLNARVPEHFDRFLWQVPIILISEVIILLTPKF